MFVQGVFLYLIMTRHKLTVCRMCTYLTILLLNSLVPFCRSIWTLYCLCSPPSCCMCIWPPQCLYPLLPCCMLHSTALIWCRCVWRPCYCIWYWPADILDRHRTLPQEYLTDLFLPCCRYIWPTSSYLVGIFDRPLPTLLQVYLTDLFLPCCRYIWPTSSYLALGIFDPPLPTLLQVYLTVLLLVSCGSW